MPFSQIGFVDSPNTAITVLYVVYEKLYYMIIWIWLALSRSIQEFDFLNVIHCGIYVSYASWMSSKIENFYFSFRIGIIVCKIGTGLFCQMLSSLMQRQLLFWMLQMHQKVNDTFIFCYFPKIFFFISVSCYFTFDFVFSYNMAKNVRMYIVLNKINGVTKMYSVYFIGWTKQLISRVCDRKKIRGKRIFII